VKTALLYRMRELGDDEAQRRRADLAASYQDAIVRALVGRVERALEETGLPALAIGGGVAANGVLRSRIEQLGVRVAIPERALCTDNAAMIGAAALYLPALSYPHYLDLDAYATGERGL
jgi:N6-L-threonylcarbamoyladenine synthase